MPTGGKGNAPALYEANKYETVFMVTKTREGLLNRPEARPEEVWPLLQDAGVGSFGHLSHRPGQSPDRQLDRAASAQNTGDDVGSSLVKGGAVATALKRGKG